MKNIHTVFISLILMVHVLFSAGCAYVGPGGSEQELVPIKSIGVLPSHSISLLPSEAETIAELEAGVETVNSLLTSYLKNYQDVSLISQSDLEGLSTEPGKYLYMAREVGRQLGFDAVLITSVERYKERKGSEYAVITPASVAFSFKLLAVESGQVLWHADFDQTQQALFENILPSTRSTGSGFRWLSAAELAAAGLTKKLDNCPYLKRD